MAKRRKSKCRRHRRGFFGRLFGRNPGAGGMTLKRPFAAATAGFKPNALVTAGIMAGGALANMVVRDRITAFLPVSWQRYGSYAVGLATGGLMGLVPKVGPRMMAGALAGEAVRAVTEFVPQVKALGTREFLDTRAFGGGMREFVTAPQLMAPGMSEFATSDDMALEQFGG